MVKNRIRKSTKKRYLKINLIRKKNKLITLRWICRKVQQTFDLRN